MSDTKQDPKEVASEVKKQAAEKREELLAKKEGRREEAQSRRARFEADREAGVAALRQLEGAGTEIPKEDPTFPTIQDELAAKSRRRRGKRSRAKARAAEEVPQAPQDEPEDEDDVEDADDAQDPDEALVASLRAPKKDGDPQPMPAEHKEALLALQMPDAMIQEWAKKDPQGLADYAAKQYQERRRREDAFANRDRTISSLNDRLRSVETSMGIGEPTPHSGAQPGTEGEAPRAAPGEGTAQAASSGFAQDSAELQRFIAGEVERQTAPYRERESQRQLTELTESLRTARREQAKTWSGLLDNATYQQKVAPHFEELYRAGVAGGDVNAIMQMAAFRGLGHPVASSEAVDPSPPRSQPGTRQGRAPRTTPISRREAGLKVINHLRDTGDVRGAMELARELGSSVG